MKHLKNNLRRRIVLFLLFVGVTCGCGKIQESLEEKVHQAELAETTTDEALGQQESDSMELHFIDVGQGDSTLIINGEHAMLIDAGNNGYGVALQLYLQNQGIRKLDYLILTHPDADHIGGADVVICKLKIDKVFMRNREKDNNTYRDVLDALSFKKLKYEMPEVGAKYDLGDASFVILGPNREYEKTNDNSIAIMLRKGDKKFLFTGDGEEEAELDMVEGDFDLNADVYHVAHHGTRHATSTAFLDKVSPEAAVLSCAYGNEYGFPHQATLNGLRKRGILLYRTDEQGSIVAYCDGTTVMWSVTASETWQGGEERRNSEEAKPPILKVDEEIYVANKKSLTLHISSCEKLPLSVNQVLFETKEEAMEAGYNKLCGYCMLK